MLNPSPIRLGELGEEELESFLKLEYECLSLAYSPKPWLVERPQYSWVKTKWEGEEASNYYLLRSGSLLYGYVYMDPGENLVYSYLCPSTKFSLKNNVLLLLRFLRNQCLRLRTVKTVLWLGQEHSRMHKTVLEAVGSPYYYTWYYRMYYKASGTEDHVLEKSTCDNDYRVVFGELELAEKFLEVIHNSFGEELGWLNRVELEKWFKETRGKIIIVYLGDQPVGAGYFHYNVSLTGENLVGYIPLLGVKRGYWGRGIGRTLVYSIIEYLVECGVEYVVVDCLDELVEYYRRLGFENAGRIVSLNIASTLL